MPAPSFSRRRCRSCPVTLSRRCTLASRRRSTVSSRKRSRCSRTELPRRALLSVSEKSGLPDFARGLAELGFELYSTGGTLTALADAGIEVHPVSDLTGFPEIMDGRNKNPHHRG